MIRFVCVRESCPQPGLVVRMRAKGGRILGEDKTRQVESRADTHRGAAAVSGRRADDRNSMCIGLTGDQKYVEASGRW